jgi:hypothetical protein
MNGHVPYRDFRFAYDALRNLFDQRGLYVWGGWMGEAARLQYVGIAYDWTLGKRFRKRYVPARSSWDVEISIAESFEEQLRTLPDTFSPLRKKVDIAKYQAAGIRLPHKGRYRRLQRAERYAKVGLDNVWYYLIPAPICVTKQELECLESELVRQSNLDLFKLFERGDSTAIPMLNCNHVARGLDHVPMAEKDLYQNWLQGSWWPRQGV